MITPAAPVSGAGPPPGFLLAEADRALAHYEALGGEGALDRAYYLYQELVARFGPDPLAPPLAGLAECFLLRYESSGNVRDLNDAYGLSVVTRRMAPGGPPQLRYVQAAALRWMHRQTGSEALLKTALAGFTELAGDPGPRIPKVVAGHAEALLDLYALHPAPGLLREIDDRVEALFVDKPSLDTPAVVAAQLARTRALYEVGYAALHVEETLEGAPIIQKGRERAAQDALTQIRNVVNILPKSSLILPLALARLSDALVFRARFRDVRDAAGGLRQEALEAARLAERLLPSDAPTRAVIHASLARAIGSVAHVPGNDSGQDSGSVSMRNPERPEDELRRAAAAGLASDLGTGLKAALAWGLTEPLAAAAAVEPVVQKLVRQTSVDGALRMGLLQNVVEWKYADADGVGLREEWLRPLWMTAAAAWPAHLATAWAEAGHVKAAILALEQRTLLVLDCARPGDMRAPSWQELETLARERPLVYLVAGQKTGAALVLDPAESPDPWCILLPGLTDEAVMTHLRGGLASDSDIEGLYYRRGFLPGLDDPLKGGFIPAYAAWQRDLHEPAIWLRALDASGQWLGEHVLAPLEEKLAGRNFTLVAVGQCGLLPLEAAWVNDPTRADARRYLSDAFALRMVPSARILLRRHSPLEPNEQPAGVPPRGSEDSARAASSSESSTESSTGLSRTSSDTSTAIQSSTRSDPKADSSCDGSPIGRDAQFVGIADPVSTAARLSYAQAEVHLAASLFPGAILLEAADATLERVTAACSQGSVVHFACHAESNFAYPLESGLLLAADERLIVTGLAALDFTRAALVVLSGCESAKVTRQSADEAVSLASVILGAGARAVIATAWDIDDPATALIMMRFYLAWKIEGAPAALALQTARHWLRDTSNGEKVRYCEALLPDLGGTAILDTTAVSTLYRLLALREPAARDHAHPHYWAAFSYYGT